MCKSGVCFELLCVQQEAPLHPNLSAEEELHQVCVPKKRQANPQRSVKNIFGSYILNLSESYRKESTFFIVGLISLVNGEERDGNLSLERGFIPNSSLILLKTSSWDHG